MGLIAEFIGRTNTAIHTVRSPGVVKDVSTRDWMPMTMMGNQQTQSVRMMKNTLLARAVSLVVLPDLALT